MSDSGLADRKKSRREADKAAQTAPSAIRTGKRPRRTPSAFQKREQIRRVEEALKRMAELPAEPLTAHLGKRFARAKPADPDLPSAKESLALPPRGKRQGNNFSTKSSVMEYGSKSRPGGMEDGGSKELPATRPSRTLSKKTPAPLPLPEKPSETWTSQPRGRPSHGSSALMLEFLSKVYGPYIEGHREELRQYIWRHDKKLYKAIANYERNHELPDDLKIASQRDNVMVRIKKAASEGLDALSPKERRSVLIATRAIRLTKS